MLYYVSFSFLLPKLLIIYTLMVDSITLQGISFVFTKIDLQLACIMDSHDYTGKYEACMPIP